MSALPPRAVAAAELMPVVVAALARGQHVRMAVSGGSMTPFLRPGDTVELAPLDGVPAVGQVVLTRAAHGAYVLHRVASVSPGQVCTQGDAFARGDPPVPLDQVLAVVVDVARAGGAPGVGGRLWWALGRLWQAGQPWTGRLVRWQRSVRGLTPPAPEDDPRLVMPVLLACLRRGDAEPADVSARLWPAVVSLAQRHGVAPLLYERLRAAGRLEAAPSALAATLRNAYLASLARGTRLTQELARILAAMADAQVPIIVLKGAYLAEAVYGNLALRPLGDVDLLAPRGRLARAASVMAALGYDTSAWRGALSERGKHLPPVVLRDGPVIELHWTTAMPGPAIGALAQELWAGSRPARLYGQRVRALSDEDQVLTLAHHMAYDHLFGGDLRPLVDVAAVVGQAGVDMDWARLVATARRRGWARGTGLMLLAARDWLGVPVPREALDGLGVTPERESELLDMLADLLVAELPHGSAQLLLAPTAWARERRAGWRREAERRGGARRASLPAALLATGLLVWQRYGPMLRRYLTGDVTVARGLRAQRRRDAWLAGDLVG